MRRLILWLAAAGTLLFAAGFAVSFLNPRLIEFAMREAIRIQVEHEVGHRVDALTSSRIVQLAEAALGKNSQQIEESRRILREEIPRKVANAVADMVKADCECRKRLAHAFEVGELQRFASLGKLRDRLIDLIDSAYANVAAKLLREFRIFTGANAIAFAVLGGIAFGRREAERALVLPALVMVGAVAITASLYLFGQNWLNIIVFNQYVGFGYAAYLVFTALLLADLVFNRARAATAILNFFGAAVSAPSC